jgi:peptide/nickel transport system ATP-binding protein
MERIIEVAGLKKTYRVGRGLARNKQVINAVDGVNFTIGKGCTFGLVGESRCGKSTLGRLLLGLEEPTGGNVRIHGMLLKDIAQIQLAKHMQPVFQDPYSSLNPRKKIGSIIGLPLRLHQRLSSGEIKRQVASVMEVVGLPQNLISRYPSQLSGGQRQRVAIARALVIRPGVVVCDEPTSALDVSAQAQVLNLLLELRKEFGLTYFFISHDLAVINHIADYIAVMYLGKIVEEGPVGEVFANPRHPYTHTLLQSVLSPDPDKEIPQMTGDVSLTTTRVEGCAFYPRCPRRMDICKRAVPPSVWTQDSLVACHLYDQKATEDLSRAQA